MCVVYIYSVWLDVVNLVIPSYVCLLSLRSFVNVFSLLYIPFVFLFLQSSPALYRAIFTFHLYHYVCFKINRKFTSLCTNCTSQAQVILLSTVLFCINCTLKFRTDAILYDVVPKCRHILVWQSTCLQC